jgi:hypothetical protein
MEFYRGEQIDPRNEGNIRDANGHQLRIDVGWANRLWERYQEERRRHLHADGSSETQARREFYVEQAGRNPENEYTQARPTLYDGITRREAEIDSTGTEITAEDQTFSLRTIEEERHGPVGVQDPELETTVPASFREWTMNNDEALTDLNLSAEYALQIHARDYQEYLCHPDFESQPLEDFILAHWQIRFSERRYFDFNPSPVLPGRTQPISFRDWLGDYEPEHGDSEAAIELWNDLITSYALYLQEQGTEEHVFSFIDARENLAVNDRREFDGEQRRDHQIVGPAGDWEGIGDYPDEEDPDYPFPEDYQDEEEDDHLLAWMAANGYSDLNRSNWLRAIEAYFKYQEVEAAPPNVLNAFRQSQDERAAADGRDYTGLPREDLAEARVETAAAPLRFTTTDNTGLHGALEELCKRFEWLTLTPVQETGHQSGIPLTPQRLEMLIAVTREWQETPRAESPLQYTTSNDPEEQVPEPSRPGLQAMFQSIEDVEPDSEEPEFDLDEMDWN